MNRLKKLSIGLLSITLLSCNQNFTPVAGVDSKTSTSEVKVIDGNALETEFKYIRALTTDDEGNLYIADQIGTSLRKLTRDGKVVTIKNNLDLNKYKKNDVEPNFNNIRYKNDCIYHSYDSKIYKTTLNGKTEEIFPLRNKDNPLPKNIDRSFKKDGLFGESYLEEEIKDFYFDNDENIILQTKSYLKYLDMKNKIIRHINIINPDIKQDNLILGVPLDSKKRTFLFTRGYNFDKQSINITLNRKNNKILLVNNINIRPDSLASNSMLLEPSYDNPISAIKYFIESTIKNIEKEIQIESQISSVVNVYELTKDNDDINQNEEYIYTYKANLSSLKIESIFTADNEGNIYTISKDNKILKITSENKVITIAELWIPLKERLYVRNLTIDNKNKILYLASNNKIYKVNIK